MVVIAPGTFMMGSPDSESDRYNDESPVHEVTIARAFALGRYRSPSRITITFARTRGVSGPEMRIGVAAASR